MPATLRAQSPPQPPAEPPPPRYELTSEFAFVGTTGNASTQTIGLGAESIYRPDKWMVRNRAAFVRNKSEAEVKAESLLLFNRAERAITTRLAGYGEYVYFRDEFAGVDHRNSVAAGLSYKLIDRAAHLLSLDGALGYLNEDRLVGDNVSSATYGAGTSYRWTLSETATVTDDLRFTGVFDAADNWRFLHNLSVTARLTGLLSLKASTTVGYVNLPVPGFKSTDTSTAIALVAKFTRPQ